MQINQFAEVVSAVAVAASFDARRLTRTRLLIVQHQRTDSSVGQKEWVSMSALFFNLKKARSV